MTRFTLRHTFPTDIDTFWTKVFFELDYNRGLYAALKYKVWEQLERRDEPDGTIHRRARLEPSFDVPALLKKVIGDGVSYVETGRYDPKSRRWAFEIVPSKMPDRVKTTGEYWVDARGAKEVERSCAVSIDASIFGIGGALESYLEKTTRESYEVAARFTREWLAARGLTGA